MSSFLSHILRGLCKQRDPTDVPQLNAAQTIKSSSGSVWHVVLAFRMEKGTTPGISCASITHCQYWRRLLCQNNNVDIQKIVTPQHIFSPSHPLLTFNHFLNALHVFHGLFFPQAECHHRSLSLFYSTSVSWLAVGFPYHG